eukprot:5539846-Pleurochrysis_carterae.AAC.2
MGFARWSSLLTAWRSGNFGRQFVAAGARMPRSQQFQITLAAAALQDCLMHQAVSNVWLSHLS